MRIEKNMDDEAVADLCLVTEHPEVKRRIPESSIIEVRHFSSYMHLP
jgi:hypothetical protein